MEMVGRTYSRAARSFAFSSAVSDLARSSTLANTVEPCSAARDCSRARRRTLASPRSCSASQSLWAWMKLAASSSGALSARPFSRSQCCSCALAAAYVIPAVGCVEDPNRRPDTILHTFWYSTKVALEVCADECVGGMAARREGRSVKSGSDAARICRTARCSSMRRLSRWKNVLRAHRHSTTPCTTFLACMRPGVSCRSAKMCAICW
mmetsp:Transcript_32603/g.81730  ORF Transcript_32603/g.81730 Transcript_32603/m.81730 type:complete len:208 (+) Transcript_32603:51-674(+)